MANYRKVARQKARKYGLDPNVFGRQINQESGYNTGARSPAGAQGIAQIMPATAQAWHVNPNDPVAALDSAAKHMAQYVKQYGSYKNALVAYNAGPGRVGGKLPAETQNYIKTILGGANPKLSAPKGGQPSYGAPVAPATTPDNRTQIALSLIGMGGLGGASYGGQDALTSALLSATQASPVPSAARHSQARPTAASSGVTKFDGKPVSAWIAPILKEARATGLWKGAVTSGVRSKSEQLAAAKRFGLQHYPNGPLASNHVEGHPGAVDVSDPQGLKRALAAIHNHRLKSAMANDPVHFSRTGY